MNTFELGKMVTDNVTGVTGMLTHLIISMDLKTEYVFQPKRLNPRTGAPVVAIWIAAARVDGGTPMVLDPPTQLLGEQGEDEATGFKGKIVALIYHINGCVHVEIKPKGVSLETGNTIESHEFDIRRVKSKLIKKLSPKALKASEKAKPSPVSTPMRKNS